MSDKIISTATAHRAHSWALEGRTLSPGQHLYDVTFDGEACGYLTASDLPQARGIVRSALREAFASTWNQTLIFRGDLDVGQVSRMSFRTAIRSQAAAHGKEYWT